MSLATRCPRARWAWLGLASSLASSACTSPVPLEAVPDASAYASAIIVVTQGGAVSHVQGYDPPPDLDRVALRDGEQLHAFLYARPLADLGLDLPLTLADDDDARAVGLPRGAEELRLELAGAARWAPLEVRPRIIDELLFRGATVEICARLGGCFADASAAERLDCDLACAGRLEFDIRRPRLPELDASGACRSGWRAEGRPLRLDPLLGEVGDAVDVRLCAPAEGVACSSGAYQGGLAAECGTLAACDAAAQVARLPADGPVAYVPAAVAGGPAGPEFPTLEAAVAAVAPGATIALGPGAWSLGAGDGAFALVGRCPQQTTVQLVDGGSGVGRAGTSVSAATVRVTGAARAEGWTVADSRILLAQGARLVAAGGALSRVRVEAEPEGGSTLELAASARVEAADLAQVNVVVAPQALAQMDDVRVRAPAAGVALDVQGALDAEDLVLARSGPLEVRVGAEGTLTAQGFGVSGEVLAGSTEVERRLEIAGRARLADARLEDVDVRVAGEAAELVLDDASLLRRRTPGAGRVLAEAGATLELARVAVERTSVTGRNATVVVRDLVAWGDEIVRVDPRTPEELDLGTPFIALVVDGGSLDAERVAFIDTPAAVAGRRAFDVRLVDATVSRSTCEPFAFGPGPVRRDLDLALRDQRRCEGVLYPASYDYPHPPEAYVEPFEVRLDGVWVRSAGLAGPFRNELQVVGAGRLFARDVRFVRTTSRGLLAQGEVALDVQRASFENPGVQGACFFPGVRLEPTPDFGFGAQSPSGTLRDVRSIDMDVGYVQLVPADVEPDVEVRGLTVQGARQGIVRARASDRTFAVPLDLGEFLIGNVLLDIEDDLQGATPNQSCD